MGIGVGFGGGVPGMTPNQLANLVLWLKSGANVTQAGTVSAWGDASGSADPNRNAVQATAGSRPTYNPIDAAYNNKATISGASKFMATGSFGPFAQPTTIFACGETDSGRLFDGSTVGNRNGVLAGGGNVWSFYAGTAVVNSVVACTAKSAICAIFNGASSKLYVNSSSAPAATGNPGANQLDVLGVLGTADGAGLGVSSKVAEIFALSRVATQAEVAAMFRYFASQFGGAFS